MQKINSSQGTNFFFFNVFQIRHPSAQCFDWGVYLYFFHATDFWSSEHSKEKVVAMYIYTLSRLSWSAVSIRTGAASYKHLVQVSPILALFLNFLELYECQGLIQDFLLGAPDRIS